MYLHCVCDANIHENIQENVQGMLTWAMMSCGWLRPVSPSPLPPYSLGAWGQGLCEGLGTGGPWIRLL